MTCESGALEPANARRSLAGGGSEAVDARATRGDPGAIESGETAVEASKLDVTPTGAKIAHALPRRRLSTLFGLFLLVVAVRMALRTFS